jgi:hypothetical protein
LLLQLLLPFNPRRASRDSMVHVNASMRLGSKLASWWYSA